MKPLALILCLSFPTTALFAQINKPSTPSLSVTQWDHEPSTFMGIALDKPLSQSMSPCSDDPERDYVAEPEDEVQQRISDLEAEEARTKMVAGRTMSSMAAARKIADLHTAEYNLKLQMLTAQLVRALADLYQTPPIDAAENFRLRHVPAPPSGTSCSYRFDKVDEGRFSVENINRFNVHGQESAGKVGFVIAVFNADMANQTAAALIEKYGKPQLDSVNHTQTKAGVQYGQHILAWRGEKTVLIFQSIDQNVEIGSVQVMTDAYYQKLLSDAKSSTDSLKSTF